MHHDDERKTERVWLRLGPELKKKIEERARADRRELAEWARLQLEKAVDRKR